jgi:hypothetical protein
MKNVERAVLPAMPGVFPAYVAMTGDVAGLKARSTFYLVIRRGLARLVDHQHVQRRLARIQLESQFLQRIEKGNRGPVLQ